MAKIKSSHFSDMKYDWQLWLGPIFDASRRLPCAQTFLRRLERRGTFLVEILSISCWAKHTPNFKGCVQPWIDLPSHKG